MTKHASPQTLAIAYANKRVFDSHIWRAIYLAYMAGFACGKERGKRENEK